MPDPWHITLLGGLRGQRGQQIITRFKYQKVGGLLAYLAYYPHQRHAREVLVELFWPESAPESGRANLSVALSSLRHQLEPPGTPAGSVLRADRYSVGLNPDMVTSDVADFEQALRQAREAGSITERAQALERATGLYQGRLLPGYYEDWVLAEQARLEGLFGDAADALIRLREEEGDLTEALRAARHAVAVDPLREEGHEQLVRLLAAAGQPGAALRQYRELERLLEAEMGAEPSAALRALAQQIQKQVSLQPDPSESPPHPKASARKRAGPAARSDLPETITFLLTDIEGTTPLRQQAGDAFRRALNTHHTTLRSLFVAHGGRGVKEVEGAFQVAFPSVRPALACAIACQTALAQQAWPPEIGPLKVRMALHTGDVGLQKGGYRGPALRHATRLLTATNGGQILVSEATAALVRREVGEGLRLVDLGVYRLRDVPDMERLYQVVYPGGGESIRPPLAAEAGHPSSLPTPFTRFFGRESEIAQLQDLLGVQVLRCSGAPGLPEYLNARTPEHLNTRLVTLTGPGGTGKTRLALAVAERLVETYQGAVWFVPLADLMDSQRIDDAICDALRLPRSPHRSPRDQVVEHLRRQPSLLVLDNFEHLVEEGARVVQDLLAAAPTLCCLVTSRRALGLSAEREFPVLPLPTPSQGVGYRVSGVGEARPTPDTQHPAPEQLMMFSSVALFVDRAQAVMPHFQVTRHNAAAVAELCDRLEGIPLAIELAASRAQVFTPGQMLSRVARRFEFLATRRRDVEQRHRTLRETLDWSYLLLAPELQGFFARLSVFRGGWTVEAAEEVCAEPLALDFLAQLRECSLILSEETPLGMRFRMLETLREYAAEQLSKDEREDACARHAAFFLRVAEEAHESLFGANCTIWLDLLEMEMENLRAALDWHQAQEDSSEGLRLAVALIRYWDMRGHTKEGYARLMAMLRGGADVTPDLLHARAYALAGHLAQYQGNYGEAAAWSEQQLAIARAIADRPHMVDALCRLGNIAYEQGDLRAAYPICAEALALARELGNGRPLAQALFNFGCVLDGQKDYAAAGPVLAESLRLYRELGDTRTVTLLLLMSASTHFGQGDYATAAAVLREALTIQESLSDRSHFPNSLEWLAMCAAHQQRPEKAARLFGMGERLREDIHFAVTPANRLLYDEHIAQIRAALGEATFTACWAEGRAMTLEQAIAYALQDEP